MCLTQAIMALQQYSLKHQNIKQYYLQHKLEYQQDSYREVLDKDK